MSRVQETGKRKMRKFAVLVAIGLVVTAAGCQRTSYRPLPKPEPLSPAPVGTVQSGQLSTPGNATTGDNGFPDAPADGQAQQQQFETAAAGAPAVTREALVGRWTISSGGSNCDLFLALTKWTGGYRAATRGCNNEAALISAWDVQGNQVMLSDNSGNSYARLIKSGEENYNGTTATGQSVSLSR